nr:hypothetical protein [Burkholderia cenocepacia]
MIDDDVEARAFEDPGFSQLPAIVKPRYRSKNRAVASVSAEGKLRWFSFIVAVVSVMVALSDAVVGGGPMPCRPRTSEYERGLAFNNSH